MRLTHTGTFDLIRIICTNCGSEYEGRITDPEVTVYGGDYTEAAKYSMRCTVCTIPLFGFL